MATIISKNDFFIKDVQQGLNKGKKRYILTLESMFFDGNHKQPIIFDIEVSKEMFGKCNEHDVIEL